MNNLLSLPPLRLSCKTNSHFRELKGEEFLQTACTDVKRGEIWFPWGNDPLDLAKGIGG